MSEDYTEKLFFAASIGNLNAMREAFDSGSAEFIYKGETIFQRAFEQPPRFYRQSSIPAVVQLALDMGAEPTINDANIAALNGSKRTTINGSKKILDLFQKHGVKFDAETLRSAAISGDQETFFAVRESIPPSAVLAADKDGNNVLHILAAHAHSILIEFGLPDSICSPEAKKTLANAENHEGFRPQDVIGQNLDMNTNGSLVEARSLQSQINGCFGYLSRLTGDSTIKQKLPDPIVSPREPADADGRWEQVAGPLPGEQWVKRRNPDWFPS